MPRWLRPPFWFVHSLAIFLRWTGRCCLYPQGSRDYKVSNKVRERYYCKTRRFWAWNLLVDCRCNACLQDYSDTHPGGTDGLISREPSMLHELRTSVMCTICSAVFGVKEETLGLLSLCFSTRGGGDLVSCILPMQDITLRRFTGPHTSLGVPDPNTLVDSQLHQMHLMHPTWFNGAHHR